MKTHDETINELILELTELVDDEIKDDVRKKLLHKILDCDKKLQSEYLKQLCIKKLIASRKHFIGRHSNISESDLLKNCRNSDNENKIS